MDILLTVEYYEKGDVVEITDNIPLNFSETCLHMKVGYGSKIKNLIGYALKKFKEPGISEISWTGHGKGFQKTLSCAEIFRKKVKGLYQVTNLRYKRTEEYWEPKLEGLDRLKVNIDVPAVTVLLTKRKTQQQPSQSWPKELDVIWRNALKDMQKHQSGDEGTGRQTAHRKSDRGHQDEKEVLKEGKDGVLRSRNPKSTVRHFDRAKRLDHRKSSEAMDRPFQGKSSDDNGKSSQTQTNDQTHTDTNQGLNQRSSTKASNNKKNTQSRRPAKQYSNACDSEESLKKQSFMSRRTDHCEQERDTPAESTNIKLSHKGHSGSENSEGYKDCGERSEKR